MKITKTTLLFIATLFFLALPLMFTSGNAQAAVFDGDGAVHNGTTGLWEVPADTATCFGNTADELAGTAPHSIDIATIASGAKCNQLQPTWFATTYPDSATCTGAGLSWSSSRGCRNAYTDNPDPAYAAARSAHDCLYCHSGGHATNRSGYLKGGHKNMSRKADGMPWAGSIENGSAIYPGYNWNNAGTSTNGTPYMATLDDGVTPVFWIYDGWIGTAPRAASPGGSYSCGRCHTTGWSADAAMQTTKEPYLSFGANIFTDVNLSAADDSDTMQPYSSWDHFGILCSKCHNAVDGGHANTGDAADDMEFGPTIGDAAASQNAKCYNCHRQVDSHNLPLDAQTRKIGEELWIADSHGALGIKSHANGFLNSPHARFSGTYGQLKDSTMYESHFTTYYGGCAGCHNLHDSVTDTAVGAEPFENECQNCHAGSHAKPLSQIQHPTGPGTPLYGVTEADAQEACHVCHMPGGIHLFRISTDPNYTTFPAANMNVPTIPNADGFPEAYVDLDMACGQCHGGGNGTTDEAAAKAVAAAHGAPYYTKAQLEPEAEIMHGGAGSSAPTGKLFMWTNDSSNAFAVNFTVNGAACTEGGCTYSWDFGDGSAAGSGPAVNHTYADGTAVTVTLTVSNGGTNAQIVTPLDVHSAPTCAGSLDVASAQVNQVVTLTDTSSADSAAGVYVNWGDGSPMTTMGLTSSATHSFIWNGNYKVRSIVQDDMGFTCVYDSYVKVVSAGVNPGSGDLVITTDANVPTSYYVKTLDAWGNLVTKVSGSFADGSETVSLAPGAYNVYLYFGSGHSCTWTQGQAATVTDGGSTPVGATGCL